MRLDIQHRPACLPGIEEKEKTVLSQFTCVAIEDPPTTIIVITTTHHRRHHFIAPMLMSHHYRHYLSLWSLSRSESHTSRGELACKSLAIAVVSLMNLLDQVSDLEGLPIVGRASLMKALSSARLTPTYMELTISVATWGGDEDYHTSQSVNTRQWWYLLQAVRHGWHVNACLLTLVGLRPL